jgi:ribosome maturation protein Sdo1
MIPDKQRPEWRDLVKGDLYCNFNNYVLQLKVNQISKEVNNGKIEIEDAVDQIFGLCKKYEKAVQTDMKKIFGETEKK